MHGDGFAPSTTDSNPSFKLARGDIPSNPAAPSSILAAHVLAASSSSVHHIWPSIPRRHVPMSFSCPSCAHQRPALARSRPALSCPSLLCLSRAPASLPPSSCPTPSAIRPASLAAPTYAIALTPSRNEGPNAPRLQRPTTSSSAYLPRVLKAPARLVLAYPLHLDVALPDPQHLHVSRSHALAHIWHVHVASARPAIPPPLAFAPCMRRLSSARRSPGSPAYPSAFRPVLRAPCAALPACLPLPTPRYLSPYICRFRAPVSRGIFRPCSIAAPALAPAVFGRPSPEHRLPLSA